VRIKEILKTDRATVRDLWGRQDLGTFHGEFSPVIPWHGAGLYRISETSP